MNEIEINYTAESLKKLKMDSNYSIENPSINSKNFDKIYNTLIDNKSGLHIYLSKKSSDKISTEAMNIEEYKQYINKKIQDIPRHSSQEKTNYTIHITDEGISTMKENSKYEDYILQSIQSILQKPFTGAFAENFMLYFGSTKEDSYGMSWGSMENVVLDREMIDDTKVKKAEKKKKGKKQLDIQWSNGSIEKKYYNLLEKEKDLSKKIKKYEDFLFASPRRGLGSSRNSQITLSPTQLAKAYYAYNIAP